MASFETGPTRIAGDGCAGFPWIYSSTHDLQMKSAAMHSLLNGRQPQSRSTAPLALPRVTVARKLTLGHGDLPDGFLQSAGPTSWSAGIYLHSDCGSGVPASLKGDTTVRSAWSAPLGERRRAWKSVIGCKCWSGVKPPCVILWILPYSPDPPQRQPRTTPGTTAAQRTRPGSASRCSRSQVSAEDRQALEPFLERLVGAAA